MSKPFVGYSRHPGLHHTARARAAALATPQRINPLWCIPRPTTGRLAAQAHTAAQVYTHTHTLHTQSLYSS